MTVSFRIEEEKRKYVECSACGKVKEVLPDDNKLVKIMVSSNGSQFTSIIICNGCWDVLKLVTDAEFAK